MEAISRRLLFRIGAVGFCLDFRDLVEIREPVAGLIDVDQEDPAQAILGALPFRQTLIPAIDLSGRLNIDSGELETALVLRSSEGNWALLAEKIEGVCPTAEMLDLELPRLLRPEGWSCFRRIALHDGAPFLCLELPVCYGGGAL